MSVSDYIVDSVILPLSGFELLRFLRRNTLLLLYFAYIAYTSNASAVRTYPKCISRELYDQIPNGYSP